MSYADVMNQMQAIQTQLNERLTMSFPNETIAREAMRRAIHKLPMKCRIVTREVGEN